MRDRILLIGVGGILFLLPFFIHPWTQYEALQIGPPKILACFLLGSFLGGIFFGKRIHPAIGLAFFGFAASVYVTGFGSLQLYSLTYFTTALVAALWFLDQAPRAREFLFRFVVYSGVVSSLFAVIQWIGYDPIFNYAPGVAREPIAFFGQTTKFGAFAAITASMALAMRLRWSYSIIAFGAIITGSSFTVLALAAGSFIALRRFPYGDFFCQVIFLLGAVAAAAIVMVKPDSTFLVSHGRFEVWAATFRAFLQNPWTGYGPGSFGAIFPQNFQPEHLKVYGDFVQAHNDYLQVLFEFGVIGLIVITTISLGVINYLFRFWVTDEKTGKDMAAAEAGFIALAVNGIGNFPWQLAPLYFFGVVFLCLLLNRVKEDKIYEWPPQTFLR